MTVTLSFAQECSICRRARARYYSSQRSRGYTQAAEVADIIAEHERCSDCHILAGAGHYERYLLSSGRCASCQDRHERLDRERREHELRLLPHYRPQRRPAPGVAV